MPLSRATNDLSKVTIYRRWEESERTWGETLTTSILADCLALQGQSALPVFLGHFRSRYDPSVNLRSLLIDATLNSESLRILQLRGFTWTQQVTLTCHTCHTQRLSPKRGSSRETAGETRTLPPPSNQSQCDSTRDCM